MRKKLFFINGNVCTGKSTISKKLMEELPYCARLDGDWCLSMNPKIVDRELLDLRYNNCCLLLNNYIHEPMIENIVFALAVDKQNEIDQMLSRLDLSNTDLFNIILITNETVWQRRFLRAVQCGERPEFITKIKHGKPIREKNLTYHLALLPKFEQLDGIKIDTSRLSLGQVVRIIKQLPNKQNNKSK